MAGLVDFVNVSVGTSGIGMVRPMYAPHLLGVRATAVVKRSMPDVPVFAVHRILTPDEAEGILERDEADAITLVRALIADPEWVHKASAERGRRDPRVHRLQPRVLRKSHAGISDHVRDESERRTRGDAGQRHAPARSTRKRVVVVGGGPAGLEAAWVAAARARGHAPRTVGGARREDPARRDAPGPPGRWPRSPTGEPTSASGAASTCGSVSTPTSTR